MSSIQDIRKAPLLVAMATGIAVTGLALASCSTPPPAPPPVAVAPPAPPPIALSSAVVQSAAGYRAYMNHVAAMSADFKSGEDVAQSLKFGAGYDPAQLLQGEIAYGAIIALQDQTFVSSLREFAADPASRQQMTQTILGNPYYVTGIKGADTAAGLVVATLMDQGQRVVANGAAVKQSAYDIQHQAWSKEPVANREQRLLDAKTASPAVLMSSSDDVARLQQAAIGRAPLQLTSASPATAFPPAVVRALAVAALAALGQAGDDQTALVTPLLADQAGANCLNMAKLNLYQCLAVSRPHYEDVFCLGQHVMMDTGQCVMIAAGAPEPAVTPRAVSTTETAYVTPKAAAHAKKRRVRKAEGSKSDASG